MDIGPEGGGKEQFAEFSIQAARSVIWGWADNMPAPVIYYRAGPLCRFIWA
jgi:hypothetical protein